MTERAAKTATRGARAGPSVAERADAAASRATRTADPATRAAGGSEDRETHPEREAREASLQAQLDATRLTLREQTEHVDALAMQVALVNRERDDLRAQLESARAHDRRREDDLLIMRASEVYLQNKVTLQDMLVAARDAEVARLGAEVDRLTREIGRMAGEIDLLDAETVRLGHERDAWHGEVVRANEELERLRGSRLWRLGTRYWRARERLGRMFGG